MSGGRKIPQHFFAGPPFYWMGHPGGRKTVGLPIHLYTIVGGLLRRPPPNRRFPGISGISRNFEVRECRGERGSRGSQDPPMDPTSGLSSPPDPFHNFQSGLSYPQEPHNNFQENYCGPTIIFLEIMEGVLGGPGPPRGVLVNSTKIMEGLP